MDITSLVGTGLGIAAIVLGQILGGGAFGQLVQGTAFLIVVGGTLGATLLSYSLSDLLRAGRLVPLIFTSVSPKPGPLISEITAVAAIVRKDGVLAIEGKRGSIRNPLLKRMVQYLLDGSDASSVRSLLELEIKREMELEEGAAKVFETAGGYAPALGIVGAIIGLIQVMSVLDQPSRIGAGIAVAFIATLYGLALSNLILLPWSSKIRRKSEQKLLEKQLVKEGVIGILEGQNPQFLKSRLELLADSEGTEAE